MGLTSPANKLCVVMLLCAAAPATAKAEPCRSESFEGTSYIVCSFDVTKDNLRLFWLRNDGKPYGTFSALVADLEAKGKSLQFAINGGAAELSRQFRRTRFSLENLGLAGGAGRIRT